MFGESLVVREKGSGTRNLLEQAICDKGFSLDNFKRYTVVSNFSVISELVANNNYITFAYEPVALHREDLVKFEVVDMKISGEFNFVYCNEKIACEKIRDFFEIGGK